MIYFGDVAKIDFDTILYLHADMYLNSLSTSQARLFVREGCRKRMMTENLKISSYCVLGARYLDCNFHVEHIFEISFWEKIMNRF